MKLHLILCLILVLIYFYYIKNLNKEYFNNNDVTYIFWTGGYDSTFRLCELLIIKKRIVQPIYVSYNLDSERNSDMWVRKNKKNEIETMNNIKKILNIRFPYVKSLLRPIQFIENNFIDNNYDSNIHKLNLWPNKRKIHQYINLGKITYHMKVPIELGVLGIDLDSNFIKFINKHIDRDTNKLIVDKNHPLYYFEFPLFNKTKKDLCRIAKYHNFDDIIRKSWSCWFPQNNKPCKKCPMCRHRFNC